VVLRHPDSAADRSVEPAFWPRHHHAVPREHAPLELPIPGEVIEALAERVAEIVIERFGEELRSAAPGRWMRTREAAAYLGWSRQAVYDRVSRKGMPHYKVDGMLLLEIESQ
jgi:excisionase family DNA binding protein